MNGIRVSILLLFLSACQAETLQIVRGRVENDVSYLGNGILAELRGIQGDAPYQAPVANSGSFEFRDVKTGTYTLRLTTMRGDPICEELVNILAFTGELSIRLPKLSQARPISGTISVGDLRRTSHPKAFRAFVEAQQARQAGHEAEATRKLEQALRIDPEYAEARCNLGVEYIRQGHYPQALEQFEKAVASGSSSAVVYANLCYSYYSLGRWQDAERAARHALDLDDRNGRAHYLLGSIMAHGIRPEALEKAPEAARHLRLGAEEVPPAHIEIARIYMAEGDRLGAAEELRLYLKTSDAGYRAKAQSWLAEILGH
jgi:tetratricopeptide (TPR) repeat protein